MKGTLEKNLLKKVISLSLKNPVLKSKNKYIRLKTEMFKITRKIAPALVLFSINRASKKYKT
jgi:hypothetical protein